MQSSPFRMKVQKVHLKFIELWHIICYNSHWFVQWSFYVNQDTLRTKGFTKISELLDSFQFVTSLFEEMQRSRACLKNVLSPITILQFDERAAEEYGRIKAELEKKGTPIGPMDTLIVLRKCNALERV